MMGLAENPQPHTWSTTRIYTSEGTNRTGTRSGPGAPEELLHPTRDARTGNTHAEGIHTQKDYSLLFVLHIWTASVV